MEYNLQAAQTLLKKADKEASLGMASASSIYKLAAKQFRKAGQVDPSHKNQYEEMALECEQKAKLSPAEAASLAAKTKIETPKATASSRPVRANNTGVQPSQNPVKTPVRHANVKNDDLCYVFNGIDVSSFLVSESSEEVSFQDVKGMEYEKDVIRNEFFVSEEDRAFNESIEKENKNFILLYGLPGTGKTFFAKAVAYELGQYSHGQIPFFSVSCSQMKDKYVGEGEHRIQAIFDFCRQFDRCVLFLDEFEEITKSRQLFPNESSSSILNVILTNLSGFNSNPGLLLIGATNVPYNIDGAILSRANEQMEIPLPIKEVRLATLKSKIGDFVDASVDLDALADQLAGYSNRDIKNFIGKAKEFYAADHKEHGQGLSFKEFPMKEEHLLKALHSVSPSSKADEVRRLQEYAKSLKRNG